MPNTEISGYSTVRQNMKRTQHDMELHLEYATAIKSVVPSSKRHYHGERLQTNCHRRWIAVVPYKLPHLTRMREKRSCASHDLVSCDCGMHNCLDAMSVCLEKQPSLTEERLQQLRGSNEQILTEEQRIVSRSTTGAQQLLWHGSPKVQNIEGKQRTLRQTFDFLWGSPKEGDIYLRSRIDRSDICPIWRSINIIPFWTHALRADCVQNDKLLELLWDQVISFQDYFMSLDTLSIAADLYQTLPQATIYPIVTGQPLLKANWYKTYSTTKSEDLQERENTIKTLTHFAHRYIVRNAEFRLHLNRGEVFTCIAMFEADMIPAELASVMAFSSGNSIYIASQLLEDPSERNNAHSVRRVVGNVGQAGIAFLVSPYQPRVRKVDDFSRNVINHFRFTGQAEDCFKGASCYLSSPIIECQSCSGTTFAAGKTWRHNLSRLLSRYSSAGNG